MRVRCEVLMRLIWEPFIPSAPLQVFDAVREVENPGSKKRH